MSQRPPSARVIAMIEAIRRADDEEPPARRRGSKDTAGCLLAPFTCMRGQCSVSARSRGTTRQESKMPSILQLGVSWNVWGFVGFQIRPRSSPVLGERK
jgi:hypothetical protein